MNKREFDLLSEKYLEGKCTPDEARIMERWGAMHYRRHTNHPFFSQESDALDAENRLWEKIKKDAQFEQEKPKRIPWMIWQGIAASLLIAMFTAWYLFKGQEGKHLSILPPPGIESKNTTDSSQRITMPDSSIVQLEAGASMVVSENYGKNTRKVYLTGEALFDVRPNPRQPFLVYTGDLVTEVLGTSFRIKPKEGTKTIEVSVMTGKVSIYTESNGNPKKRDGVIITPNQKVVFDTESKMMRQDLVDFPDVIVPPAVESSFIFEDTPVQEVFELLEKTYGVEIVIGNVALKRCVFTGDLNGIKLYQQLDYICDALRITYEIRGTGIFISGGGCG
jgi:transmembrane sensor